MTNDDVTNSNVDMFEVTLDEYDVENQSNTNNLTYVNIQTPRVYF